LITPIHTSSQLLSQPALGLALAPFFALLFYPMFGLPGSAWVGGTVGLCLSVQLVYTTWRSVYGSTQGLTSSIAGTAFLSALAGGASSGLLVMAKHSHLAPWALGGAVAITVLGWLVGARQAWLALRQHGQSGAWFREAVNVDQGWVVEAVPTGGRPWAGFWASPWMIGALAVNTTVLLRAQGWTDLNIMSIAAPVMTATAAWIGWAISGPMLARGLYLRQLERQLGITFVHPQLDEIQALRSRWFFTRWLMPKRPALPGT
jgi:hypothetical protein